MSDLRCLWDLGAEGHGGPHAAVQHRRPKKQVCVLPSSYGQPGLDVTAEGGFSPPQTPGWALDNGPAFNLPAALGASPAEVCTWQLREVK